MTPVTSQNLGIKAFTTNLIDFFVLNDYNRLIKTISKGSVSDRAFVKIRLGIWKKAP
ncbi:hypothetical protein MC7420_3781 [Coleofasciculus chthonoplastes PCC 7420]|uniref:Uncharacterized protein n=1 Tax=Coleofasciculus chthonoplastes PCC 7420 TaxID=118168 RepID=B4VX22_9CYAN|nr:hypothetical protein MC7420_3781 [Coleofasciculus chthonoplastes PCC 7420]